MINNNMCDCADMPPMFSAKWNIDDSSGFLHFFFCEFLVFKCIFVIHCCFSLELVEKNMYSHLKKIFLTVYP
jgi:hypothetical protein